MDYLREIAISQAIKFRAKARPIFSAPDKCQCPALPSKNSRVTRTTNACSLR